MTITELITALETIREEHGDLEVVTGDEWAHAPQPTVQEEWWDFVPEGVTVPLQVSL